VASEGGNTAVVAGQTTAAEAERAQCVLEAAAARPAATSAQDPHAPARVIEGDAEPPAFLDPASGQERVEADVAHLLSLYASGQNVHPFLAALPLFTSGKRSLTADMHAGISSLLQDRVNSHAAMAVRPYVADTCVYALHVLAEASGRSLGVPSLFVLDIVTALIHSVLNKDFVLTMGKWKSKSRHWWNGIANVGEGKSAAMKMFVDDMIEVLKSESSLAVGAAEDRFHFQQSGTTAGAIDKLQTCQGYLVMYCSDAGRCLSKTAATGGKTDPHEHINLEFFLDAAHGDEFDHSNKCDRDKILKKPMKNPAAPNEPPLTLHIDPTNVHLIYLQQEVFFQTWWAQIAVRHPVGLPQRCLFAFGGDMDPAPKAWNGFFEEVTRPIIKRLFSCIVRRVGPKVTGTQRPMGKTREAQDAAVTEIDEVLKLFKRRVGLSAVLQAALPKSMYWLGTACISNLLIAQYWRASLLGVEPPPLLRQDVADEEFGAAVCFMYRRYLAGQCVLAVTAQEQSWLSKDLPFACDPTDLKPVLVRVLRGAATAIISRDVIVGLDLDIKRALQREGTVEHREAEIKLERILRSFEDLGLGRMRTNAQGAAEFHKFRWDGLSAKAVEWLQNERVPGYLFGIATRRQSAGAADAGTAGSIRPSPPAAGPDRARSPVTSRPQRRGCESRPATGASETTSVSAASPSGAASGRPAAVPEHAETRGDP